MTVPVVDLRMTTSSDVSVSTSVSDSVGLKPVVDGPWKVPVAVAVFVTVGSVAVSDVGAPVLLSRLRPWPSDASDGFPFAQTSVLDRSGMPARYLTSSTPAAARFAATPSAADDHVTRVSPVDNVSTLLGSKHPAKAGPMASRPEPGYSSTWLPANSFVTASTVLSAPAS